MTHPLKGYDVPKNKPAREIKGLFSSVSLMQKNISLLIYNLLWYQKEQSKLSSDLKAAIFEKENIYSTLSHDIKTPLNAIKLGLDSLSIESINAVDRNTVHDMKTSVKYLFYFLNSINELDEHGINNIKTPSELKISVFTSTMIEIIRPLMVSNKIKLEVIVKDSVPNELILPKEALYQCSLNLIGNAIRHSETSIIRVKISVSDLMFKIAFVDYGKGFVKENTTEDSSVNSESRQSVGLYLTQMLCSRVGGKLAIYSSLNRGTVATIHLPFCRVPEKKALVQSEVNPVVNESNESQVIYNVLLAEDFEICSKVMKKLGKMNFIDIEVASDGLEAVKMARKTRYDLILMDLQMPVMSGIKACQIIRKNSENSDVSIFGLSAEVDKKLHQLCIEAGMDKVIQKPIDFQRMRNYLSNSITPVESGK
ncbi:response regulator [uncultured Vibrio sp.]|uniref:hybrid sensor histidine kinase/response regulator n=1 Tax=uncultured Vibrio sp. TaxID=114054 RepID=UPI00261475C9|nr:response regulator [uncultured Vibrio sp.]